MGFRDMLDIDVTRAFLDDGVFAETVTIDGQAVVCVKTDACVNAASATGFTPDPFPSLPLRDVTLWLRTADIPGELAQGGTATVDGELCTVLARHDGLGGMTRLELQRHGY